MNSEYFCYVENNEIKAKYIKRGSINPITKKKMGLDDSDEFYKTYNLYPIVDEPKPSYNEFSQYIEGPFLKIEDSNKTIIKYWNVIDIPFDALKIKLLNQLNEYAKEKEISGIDSSVYGMIRTDEKTQMRLSQALLQVTIDENYEYDWKMSNGTFIILDKNKIIEIYNLVNNHVEKCFSFEKHITDLINNISTIDELVKFNIENEWNKLNL